MKYKMRPKKLPHLVANQLFHSTSRLLVVFLLQKIIWLCTWNTDSSINIKASPCYLRSLKMRKKVDHHPQYHRNHIIREIQLFCEDSNSFRGNSLFYVATIYRYKFSKSWNLKKSKTKSYSVLFKDVFLKAKRTWHV